MSKVDEGGGGGVGSIDSPSPQVLFNVQCF